jgi:hypothetical protein
MLKKFNQFLLKESNFASNTTLEDTKKKLDIHVDILLRRFLEDGFKINTEYVYGVDFDSKKINLIYSIELTCPIRWASEDSDETSLTTTYHRMVDFFTKKYTLNSIKTFFPPDTREIKEIEKANVVKKAYSGDFRPEYNPEIKFEKELVGFRLSDKDINNILTTNVKIKSYDLTLGSLLSILHLDEYESCFTGKDNSGNIDKIYMKLRILANYLDIPRQLIFPYAESDLDIVWYVGELYEVNYSRKFKEYISSLVNNMDGLDYDEISAAKNEIERRACKYTFKIITDEQGDYIRKIITNFKEENMKLIRDAIKKCCGVNYEDLKLVDGVFNGRTIPNLICLPITDALSDNLLKYIKDWFGLERLESVIQSNETRVYKSLNKLVYDNIKASDAGKFRQDTFDRVIDKVNSELEKSI